MRKIIVTGGAGFIGRCFVKIALANDFEVIVLDKLTYSGNLDNLAEFSQNKKYRFIKGDICDDELVHNLLMEEKPDAVINFAAESHVDNSINEPSPFINTNIIGTYNLLKNSLKYYENLNENESSRFRFIQISTDEVYGSLTKEEAPFSLRSQYAPNSPYSASKAAADHLARAWFETYNLPVIITNCSNNFGPYQHEEKLIPKVITCAINGEDIPVYGKGENIRDWIFVDDHAHGILLALLNGIPGKKYLFGGDNEIRNIDLVHKICKILEEKTGNSFANKIKFVVDRKGHDYRYAIDSSMAKRELGFKNNHLFDDALEMTVNWYINKG